MMLPKLTIRQRLTLLISFSALLILLLEGYFIYEYMVRYCEVEFKDRIQKRLVEADSLIARDRQHPFTALSSLPPGNLPEEKFYYSSDPRKVLLPGGTRLPLVKDTAQFFHLGKRDYGILQDSFRHYTLVLSAVDLSAQGELHSLRNGIFFGVILGVLLLTLIIWFWVKRMLQPVADKIKKAQTIGTQSLDLRLEVKNNYDELGQLAQTFNEMLDRIEQGFRTQQQFIRNASHEMRTPITTIIAEVDLALHHDRSPEAYKQSMENLRLRAENLNELVTQLLIMAKIENSYNLKETTCAADEVLLSAIKTLQAKYPKAKELVQLKIEAPDPAQFLTHCDPVILQTAFFNLLDNALKYGNNQMVIARLYLSDQLICLEILDHGLGIEPHELLNIFEPFYRIKRQNNPPGSGIGLSLVKSIAERHGGSVQLSSKLGLGTTAQFSLPSIFVDKNQSNAALIPF